MSSGQTIMDENIFKSANEIRILKELTITKIAAETNINRGNLNAWLNSGSPDRLSSDKIKKILDYLEIEPDPLRLLPGVHRFTIPSPTSGSVSVIESVIFKLFPDGGTYYHIFEKSRALKVGGQLECDNNNEPLFTGIRWKRWVAVPKLVHNIRIIFKMGEKAKHINRYVINNSLSAPFISGVCGWNNADSKIFLPDQLFARLSSDESLTVSELDKIISYPLPSNFLWTGDSIAAEEGTEYDSGWTWEAIMSKAKEAGLKPEEVAKRLGL
jgi:transcriptional regulator with XRE-family HTH domain